MKELLRVRRLSASIVAVVCMAILLYSTTDFLGDPDKVPLQKPSNQLGELLSAGWPIGVDKTATSEPIAQGTRNEDSESHRVDSSSVLVDKKRKSVHEVVLQAIKTRDPKDAWEAFLDISLCQNSEKMTAVLEEGRTVKGVTSEMIRSLIESNQARIRECQFLTPDLVEKKLEIGLLAVQGQVVGASSAVFLETHRAGLTQEVSGSLLRGLRSDADNGIDGAISALAIHGAKVGLPIIEQRAYSIVQDELTLSSERNIEISPEYRFSVATLFGQPKLVGDDEVRAQAMAREILAKYNSGISRRKGKQSRVCC